MQAQAEVAVTEGAPRLEQVRGGCGRRRCLPPPGGQPPPLRDSAASPECASPECALTVPLQKAPVMAERKHREVDKRSLTWSQICKSLAAGGVAGAV